GPDDARVVAHYYDATPGGNFEGHSILYLPRPASAVATDLGVTVDRLAEVIAAARPKLYAARDRRVHAGRDEKALTSWNGMMLRALAAAARSRPRRASRDAARRNAEFLLGKLRKDGRLLHTYKDGRAKLNGYLEDYANLIDGLIALYEATFERRWIEE